jgi:Dehydrogenase E1 component
MPNKIANEAAAPPGGDGFSIISKTTLLALYQALLRCRALDNRLAGSRKLHSFRPGGNGSRSLRPSPHAAAVAAIIDLASGDTVVASKADFIPRLLRGASANALLASLRNGVLSATAPSGWLLERALTAGRARKRQYERKIAVVFAANESGTPAAWRETLRTAAAERLPMLFICSDRSARGGAKDGAKRYGIPSISVDANDVVALYRVAFESIAHARRGNGPTLIECVPWPASLARNGAAAPHDAIQIMERYLAHAGIPFPQSKRKSAEEFAQRRRTRERRSNSASNRQRARLE